MLHDDRADRDAVDQERAGVVEQALAFEDHQDPVRQLDLAQERSPPPHPAARRWRRARSPPPRASRAQPVRHQGHGDRGQADRGEHQRRDRRPVVAQVAQRGVEGRVQQDRRDEERQGELGIERPGRLYGMKAISAPPMARKVG